jgi:hypothetical protein
LLILLFCLISSFSILKAVAGLHERFAGEFRPALIPSRSLLHDGGLVVSNASVGGRRRRLHVWLFNDILVWGDDGRSSINVHGYISLSTVPRVQLDDVAVAATAATFVLPSSEAELHLVAPSVEERGVWVNAIMRAVRLCEGSHFTLHHYLTDLTVTPCSTSPRSLQIKDRVGRPSIAHKSRRSPTVPLGRVRPQSRMMSLRRAISRTFTASP